MNRFSSPYRFNKKVFIYDRDEALVCWVTPITKKTEDWEKDLCGTINDKWLIIDSVGLRRENWRNKECRDEYLDQWCFEIEEELAYTMDEFRAEMELY